LVGLVWGADPFIGTWKLNPSKTKVTGPGSAYKSGTATFVTQENGVKFTYDIVNGEGKSIHGEYAAKYDGKDYPITGDPDADTVSLRKTDDHTVDYLYKKAGKEVMSERAVVAKDGKTATVTFKGKNPKGEEFTTDTVWDKQ